MPVNDSPLAADAEVNCALCCVAGIAGTTAEAERAAVIADIAVPVAGAAAVFLEYAFRKCNVPRSDVARVTLPAQVLGVQHWLMARHGLVVNTIGDTTNPLSIGVLGQQLQASPLGTRFVVLVMDWDSDFRQATGAHWLTAARAGGGVIFTDYQLDVPAGMIAAMRATTKRAAAPFGQPSVTDGPREAWADASGGTNRYMALRIDAAAAAGGCCFKCYITTATCAAMGLADDCVELETLRRYRDEVMLATPQGAAEVADYYAGAPAVVAAIAARADAAAIYRRLYAEHIRPAAAAAAAGDHERTHALYCAGVRLAQAIAAEG